MNPEFTGPELVVGTVRGYRRWDVRNGHLKAVSWGTKWTAGVNTATCRMPFGRLFGGTHITAGRGCSCGFYAYFHPKDAFYSGAVQGVVEGYGRVTLGSKGFRAEKARILGLVAPRFHVSPSLLMLLGNGAWFFVSGPLITKNAFPFAMNLLSLVASLLLVVMTVLGGGWGELLAFRPKLRKQLRENYPDVPLYHSRRALLRAHPLHPEEYVHLRAAA